MLADSRYTIQARREAPETRVFEAYQDLPSRWPELVASVGARRVAVEAGFVSHALWDRLAAAAPDVELVPVEGWVEADRAIKEPAEIERIAAACAVADRALAALLPEIRPGVTEADLALRLEWLMRTGGAEALAFDVACLSGPEAALPHGAPGDRPVLDGDRPAVRLRGAGRGLSERHDADPVRRRAGGARPRDLRARGARPGRGHRGARGRRGGRHGVGRRAAERPGHRRASPATSSRPPATATTSGTGPATASASRRTSSRRSAAWPRTRPLPSPTVFSVEPGVYLDGEMGVRIEDLVLLDAGGRPGRAADPVPARGHRAPGLTRDRCRPSSLARPVGGRLLRSGLDPSTDPAGPRVLAIERPAGANAQEPRPHDQHR